MLRCNLLLTSVGKTIAFGSNPASASVLIPLHHVHSHYTEQQTVCTCNMKTSFTSAIQFEQNVMTTFKHRAYQCVYKHVRVWPQTMTKVVFSIIFAYVLLKQGHIAKQSFCKRLTQSVSESVFQSAPCFSHVPMNCVAFNQGLTLQMTGIISVTTDQDFWWSVSQSIKQDRQQLPVSYLHI